MLIKSAFSRGLPRGERISASRSTKGERGIWQRRYWQHTIRNDDDCARHMWITVTPSHFPKSQIHLLRCCRARFVAGLPRPHAAAHDLLDHAP